MLERPVDNSPYCPGVRVCFGQRLVERCLEWRIHCKQQPAAGLCISENQSISISVRPECDHRLNGLEVSARSPRDGTALCILVYTIEDGYSLDIDVCAHVRRADHL